jgi:uncharacterized protein (TIGR02757 family)
MFLRWMVRRDVLDLGLWTRVSPADLIVPLDTHVFRISRFLGWTRRRQADWSAAEEVTAALRRHCPEDPVRYDFALARLGIVRDCKGRRVPGVCDRCDLSPACRAGQE